MEVTEQSDTAERMKNSIRVELEFTDSGNNEEIEKEIIAILKNNYLERILSGVMQNNSDAVRATSFSGQRKGEAEP